MTGRDGFEKKRRRSGMNQEPNQENNLEFEKALARLEEIVR